jgi:glycosyltransferase involved in cell wall biosynthesis
MRISVVSFSRRKIGGAEQNLDVVLPEFERRGHHLQFVYFHDEREGKAGRAPVRTSTAVELVDVEQTGPARALDRVRAFHPDVINVHGDIAADFQAALIAIAPSAYSVHNYYGTCISGLKTHSFPVIQPCDRVFGPLCLLEYFPRRCGGLSPITMVRRYLTERDRLAVMAKYQAVITHSARMELEYRRHGLHPARVFGLPYEVRVTPAPKHNKSAYPVTERPQLLFAGRMDRLKGGLTLLDALPLVHLALARPLDMVFAGDGPERQRWQRKASALGSRHPEIRCRFTGWLSQAELTGLFESSHALVVPSQCPEAFGKIGPEAAGCGLPAAAFAVGGIEEWLIPGVSGALAPGNPPTASGLAQAICEVIADPDHLASLSLAAIASVGRFDLNTHVDRLLALFEQIRK